MDDYIRSYHTICNPPHPPLGRPGLIYIQFAASVPSFRTGTSLSTFRKENVEYCAYVAQCCATSRRNEVPEESPSCGRPPLRRVEARRQPHSSSAPHLRRLHRESPGLCVRLRGVGSVVPVDAPGRVTLSAAWPQKSHPARRDARQAADSLVGGVGELVAHGDAGRVGGVADVQPGLDGLARGRAGARLVGGADGPGARGVEGRDGIAAGGCADLEACGFGGGVSTYPLLHGFL